MNGLVVTPREIIFLLLVFFGVGLALSAILVAWVFIRVRRLNIPAAADFFETLRLTPLSVVIMLDVLDLALDIFSAPISWLILDRLNLKPLRWITAIEALIPFSDVIPTMTAAWLLARAVPNLHVPENAPPLVKLLVG